eukprot:TRINITY_DN7396_c0_g1_i1.p1 TRINITY_DN7396_c0_g1~~TRINITY_DN7396_c0_g1_i1.p1  ORF type:complete len:249 (+),score=51.77 TRINITY_DN7396_c0_g1_i1:78-824(+)
MPTTCAVYHCPSPRGLTYHVFPSDPVQASRWAGNWTKRKVLNYRNARICSNHFKNSDYKRDLRNELLGLPLRKIFMDPKNVVPTLNLNPVDQDSGNSDDGSDAFILPTNIPFTPRNNPSGVVIHDERKKDKDSRGEASFFQIFESKSTINQIKKEPNLDDEENDSHQEQYSSLSDLEWSDSESSTECKEEENEDPYVIIQRLKEQLFVKSKRIKYLKSKLRHSKHNKQVGLVYVQKLSHSESRSGNKI